MSPIHAAKQRRRDVKQQEASCYSFHCGSLENQAIAVITPLSKNRNETRSNEVCIPTSNALLLLREPRSDPRMAITESEPKAEHNLDGYGAPLIPWTKIRERLEQYSGSRVGRT